MLLIVCWRRWGRAGFPPDIVTYNCLMCFVVFERLMMHLNSVRR